MSFNSLPQNNYYQSEDNQFLDFTLPDDMADIDFTQYLTEGAFQEHNVTVNSSDSLPNFAMGHTNTQLSNDNGMIYQAQDSFVVDSSDNVDGGNYANNNVFSQDDASISCYPEFNTMEIPNFYDGEAMQTGYTGDMGNDTFVLPQAPQFHMPPIDSEVQKMFDMHFNDLLRTEKSFLLLSKTLFGRLTGQQKLDLAKLTGYVFLFLTCPSIHADLLFFLLVKRSISNQNILSLPPTPTLSIWEMPRT